MNKVTLIGRLTNDIELRYTANQTAVASFALAINRGKDKNGTDKGADFPRCIAFSKIAETLSKYSKKGGRLAVEGHIQTGNYQKKDGSTVYTTDIIVDRFEIIDWADDGQKSPQYPVGFEAISDDDCPF